MHFAKIQPTNIQKQYKKMGKSETFNTLKEMQKFLTERKQITALAELSKVSTRTVYDTFNAPDFENLSGKQLTVALKAVDLIKQIKSMPEEAENLLR